MDFFIPADPEHVKRERNKARDLRAGAWWQNQQGTGLCYYCGTKVAPSQLTMDHKTPVIRGGKTNKQNVVPCCKECNNDKKHMTLNEWILSRGERGLPLPKGEDDPWT